MYATIFALTCILYSGYGQHKDDAGGAQLQTSRNIYVRKLEHDVASPHSSQHQLLLRRHAKPSRKLTMLFLALNPQVKRQALLGHSRGAVVRDASGNPARLTSQDHYRNYYTPMVRMQLGDEGTKGAVGGAVLGGLLAGPFGALWGAQLGGMMGSNQRENRERKDQLDSMGLSQDVLKIAQQTAQELANAESSLKLVEDAERSQSKLVKRLEDAVSNSYAVAEKCLRGGDENGARSFLEEWQSLKVKKEAAEKELNAASRRVAMMQSSVSQLAFRATEIEQMISRTVASKSTINSNIGASYSPSANDFEDPMERKFRDLEGK